MKNIAVKCVVIKAKQIKNKVDAKACRLEGSYHLKLETGEFAIVSKAFFEKAFQFMDIKIEEKK